MLAYVTFYKFNMDIVGPIHPPTSTWTYEHSSFGDSNSLSTVFNNFSLSISFHPLFLKISLKTPKRTRQLVLSIVFLPRIYKFVSTQGPWLDFLR